jgi:hypothetical protein
MNIFTAKEQQIITAERRYLGRNCWKTGGFKTIHTGVIRQIRLVDNWVEGQVYWQTKNGEDLGGHPNSWERVANLGFNSLPEFKSSRDKGEDRVGSASNALTPWSGHTSSGLRQGPTDCLSQVTAPVDCQGDGIPEVPEEDGITKTACTKTEVHPHVRAPKRVHQSEEANRAFNYRALLATIDNRDRDAWHLLCLNETLKREGCNTITLPAFKMRVDKFAHSLYNSADDEGSTVISFLQDALNGDWHGSIGSGSIWSRY